MLAMLNKIQATQRRAEKLRPIQVQGPTRVEEAPSLEAYWRARFPRYHYATHINYLVQELSSLKSGDAVIINMPPRHGKSETVGAFLEWWLGQNPDRELMYAAYSARLAQERSRKMRNEIAAGAAFARYFPNVCLARDSKSIGQWKTSHEGGMLAAGVGGSLTGMGAHLAIIDDPLKGRREAESELIRQNVINWFKSDFLTRLSPDGILIVIQTRWHTHDLTGWLLENIQGEDFGAFNWRVINLPALAEDGDALGRSRGQALWPERWPEDKLQKNRHILGEYDFSALYQQQPYVRGGSIFLDGVSRYDAPNAQDARIVIALDTASSKRTSADYSVFSVLAGSGASSEVNADILEVRRGRWALLELGAVAQELQQRYGVEIIVEQTAQSLPIIQYLESMGIRARGVRPIGDKFTRAQPLAAAWNSGRVRVPVSAPWLGDLMAELTAFTGTDGDAHDDQVDSLAYAWDELVNAPVFFIGRA